MQIPPHRRDDLPSKFRLLARGRFDNLGRGQAVAHLTTTCLVVFKNTHTHTKMLHVETVSRLLIHLLINAVLDFMMDRQILAHSANVCFRTPPGQSFSKDVLPKQLSTSVDA